MFVLYFIGIFRVYFIGTFRVVLLFVSSYFSCRLTFRVKLLKDDQKRIENLLKTY